MIRKYFDMLIQLRGESEMTRIKIPELGLIKLISALETKMHKENIIQEKYSQYCSSAF